jgi:hypothetical protein
MTEQYAHIEALLGIDLEILPTESAAPRPDIVKNHAPAAMLPGRRHCSVFPNSWAIPTKSTPQADFSLCSS